MTGRSQAAGPRWVPDCRGPAVMTSAWPARSAR